MRGTARREALLAALAQHLAVTPWRDAKVMTIARLADCTAGLFYQHFESLDDAVRVLIDRARAAQGPLDKHLEAIALLLDVEQQLPAAP